MNKIFTLIVVLSCSLASAQFTKGTVFLKDSTELKGLIKVKTFGGIKFKTAKNAEATSYDHTQITGFDSYDGKYRYLKKQDGLSPKLYRENLKGKISLYSTEVINPGVPNNFGGGGITYSGGSTRIYHIVVENKLIRVGTKLKKKHLKFLKDCTSLMEKMKSKVYRKKDIYEIISYYNICG